eukprot:2977518-Prymnesium_polylepis.1
MMPIATIATPTPKLISSAHGRVQSTLERFQRFRIKAKNEWSRQRTKSRTATTANCGKRRRANGHTTSLPPAPCPLRDLHSEQRHSKPWHAKQRHAKKESAPRRLRGAESRGRGGGWCDQSARGLRNRHSVGNTRHVEAPDGARRTY